MGLSKEYLTIQQFAHYEGRAERTIWRWIGRGEIPVIKEKGRTKYRQNHIVNYIHSSHLSKEGQQRLTKDRELGKTEKTQKEISELKPWQRKEADKRQAIVRDYINAKKDAPWGKTKAVKRQFAKSHRVSYRSLDRWEAGYKSGGYHALVPAWTPGNQQKLITNEIAKFIETTYMQAFGPTVRQTYEFLFNEFRDKNLELPCYRTVASWVNQKWTKGQQLLIRNKEEWDRFYSPYVRRDWTQAALNEVWFGDGKQIDTACKFRRRVIFPWLTPFLDARSEKFVGWILTATPDSWAIAQAFVDAVSTHGVPGTIYVDRGKPYKSHMIAGSKLRSGGDVIPFNDLEETVIPGLLRELGCEVFFAAPYNAREKLIESNFRIFTERLKHLPGYRGHSTKTRPKKLEREIKAGQLLSFEELSQEIDTLINERNERVHGGTGKSPNSFYDNFTPEIPSREMLAFLLMDSHLKRVKDATVTIKGMVYRNDELWKLAGETVCVRRDPKDLREAAIIYNDKLFGFARLEVAAHYRSAVTLESAKTAARIRRKIRNYRTAVIEHEGIIHDPLKFAAELDEKEKLRARDIRPPDGKVISLHKKERLAREVTKGLKERSAQPEEEAVGVGQRPRLRLVQHLTLDDPEE